MQFLDARRLTGPNLLARVPLVVVELGAAPDEDAVTPYLAELARMRGSLGMDPVTPIVRPHHGGVVVGYAAPIDTMLAHAEISEWAGMSAVSTLPLEPKRAEIEGMLAAQSSPLMLAHAAEAKRRGLPFLWDDDEISIGAGARSITWPRNALPGEVPWDDLGTIPIALITGTNGKTTSSRLLARVAREAGFRVGNTSSDEITIDGKNVDTGDCTGPFAARFVLRHKNVEFAVLETARGGVLRRGLAVDACDAALVTNVTEDHTGGYGIDDLAAMTQVKGVVARAGKKAVLNAQDPKLLALAEELPDVTLFGKGGSVVAENGFVRVDGKDLIAISEIPITFGGAARHNVENVLGVVALARALGLPDDAILRGLRGFGTADNAGRGEIVERNGVRIMLDFGHNPEGVRSVLDLVAALRGEGRLFVSVGGAGDRGETEVREMCRVIVNAGTTHVFVRELEGYLRGRARGEMPAMFERFFAGALPLTQSVSEVASLAEALGLAEKGDFVVVLVHLEREAVRAFLR